MNVDILFISYFTGIRGMVMAEWADDKIRVLESLNLQTIVITGISSGCVNSTKTRYIKIPPVSWREFQFEKSQIQDSSPGLAVLVILFTPIAFIFGKMFDFLTRRVITNENPARWSWAFSSLPITTYFRFRHNVSKVFATGGALSAQLLGSLIPLRGKSSLYLEFQDPIVGNEIVRTERNQYLMSRLEEFLIKRSTKSYFVTRAAMNSAISRHPNLTCKISFLYPGSWRFATRDSQKKFKQRSTTLLHLGTLYGSRNMDNLFEAIDNLKNTREWQDEEIMIVNLGSLYLDNTNTYLRREDFKQIFEQSRFEALNIASTADALLLIQHKDNRSLETIPYKTYDYLNLGLPIMGITNNSELDSLIEDSGGVIANANSVPSIQASIDSLLTKLRNPTNSLARPDIKIGEQFMKLLENTTTDKGEEAE